MLQGVEDYLGSSLEKPLSKLEYKATPNCLDDLQTSSINTNFNQSTEDINKLPSSTKVIPSVLKKTSHLKSTPTKSKNYIKALSNLKLYNYIKSHVVKVHQPKYDEFDVVLTKGNTDGLYNMIKLTMDTNQVILVERWCYPTAMETFQNSKLNILSVEIDEQGIIPKSMVETIEKWKLQHPKNMVKALYTVPCGHNPTGTTMSFERRQQIYTICQHYKLLIFEDDPYYYLQLNPQNETNDCTISNEYSFSNLLPSLFSLDVDGRVIRLDTFAKTVAPSLRIGFVTANRKLCTLYKELNVTPTEYDQEKLVGTLISEGNNDQFEVLLKELRFDLSQRINQLTNLLNQINEEENLIQFVPPKAGIFIWLQINPKYQFSALEGSGNGKVGTSLFSELVHSKTLLVPSTYFDAHTFFKSKDPSCKEFKAFRLAFASNPMDEVMQQVMNLVAFFKTQ